jgi:hypothetical protein
MEQYKILREKLIKIKQGIISVVSLSCRWVVNIGLDLGEVG